MTSAFGEPQHIHAAWARLEDERDERMDPGFYGDGLRPQTAVGRSRLASTVMDMTAIRNIYISRLALALVRERGWAVAYALRVAERYTRLFGMQARVGR